MYSLIFRIRRKFRFLTRYIKSYLLGVIYSGEYNNIETCVLFVGYPRSGHSLIASLLDAHPNIIMGMEWDLLNHLRMGYGKNQIFYSLIRNSILYSKRKKNIWTGYSYWVEGMWQGKYKTLRTIGEKYGGRTSLILRDNIGLLTKLEDEIKLPVKFIHVIRNPYDTISTMTLRLFKKKKINREVKPLDLLPIIGGYFKRVEFVNNLKESGQYQVFDIYHEEFIKNPKEILKNLICFFDLDPYENYLNSCAEIIFKKPNKSRTKIEWPEDLISFVQTQINRYDFLKSYTFIS